MTFSAVLSSRSWAQIVAPPGVTFKPVRWAWDHHYGPYTATVEARGNLNDLWNALAWLRYGIEIFNPDQDAVWWGFVNEVQLMSGSLAWSASLEDMYNAVTVLYSYVDIDGNETTGETSATTDADSIAKFGRKEILRTTSDIDSTQADYLRDQILADRKHPIATPANSSGNVRAVLHCRGYAHAYTWVLYGNNAGKLEHATGSDRMQKLGWGYSSTNIGFSNDNRIMDLDGALANLTTDDLIRITGTTSNNGNRTVTESDDRGQETYTSITISFDADDDIMDSELSLGFIDDLDMIEVTNAANATNNDFHLVNGTGEHHIRCEEAWNVNLVTEAAGNNVTIKRGGTIKTDVAGGDELPGTSFTITAYGDKIAQSFTNNSGAAWTVDSISLYLQKIGAPTDDITVKLYTDSASEPDTLVESITLDGDDIGAAANWIEISFANTNTISNSTVYWIVLERTGANDNDDYFAVGITESNEYTSGELKLHNGSAYVASTNNDMMFRVWGAEATTDQIEDMLNDSNLTAMDAVDIVTGSSVNSNQYRRGDRTVLDEIKDLIDIGTSSANALYFEVTRGSVACVKAAPTKPTQADYMLTPGGKIRDQLGRPLPLGRCVVADRVELVDIPSNIDVLNLVSPVYVTRCEYHADRDVTIPTAKGAPNPFDIGRITR